MNFIKKINQENKLKIIKFILLASLIIVTSNSLIYLFEKYITGDRYIFFDLPLNYCAGELFSNNISPYGFGLGKAPLIECVNKIINGDWGMPVYIYSPIFLEFLSPISKINYDLIRNSWYLITAISIFFIIFFSYKVLPINNLKKIMPLIILFSFGGILFNAIFTGNISILAYSLVALSLVFLHKKKLNLFSLIIIILTLIKPHFFIFLLMGFIVYGKEYIKYIFLSLLIIIFSYFAFFIYKTPIFIDFLQSIQSVSSKEWFFSYNSTFGLTGILNNLPIVLNNLNLNIYFSGGPNMINKIIWLILVFFIFLSLIYFRLFTNITNLNSHKKSNLIAFGSIIILLINPNVTIYDFFIFIPSAYYLINEFKFNNTFLDNVNFKYSVFLLFVIVQDINFPFFIATLIYFIVIFKSIKNNNILNLSS